MQGVSECPICGGLGWKRYPVEDQNDPNFGCAFPCECTIGRFEQQSLNRLLSQSEVPAFFMTKSFDKIEVGRDVSLGMVYEKCSEIITSASRGLLIIGWYGTGKTRFLTGSVLKFLQTTKLRPAKYMTFADLVSRMQQEIKQQDSESIYDSIKNMDLLAIDDIGTSPMTDWAQGVLDQLVDYRYAHNLGTIAATNLNDLPERTLRRFGDREWGSIIVIKAKPWIQR